MATSEDMNIFFLRYKSYKNRRESFDEWPLPFINPDDLAEAGFYHVFTLDVPGLVRCIFCKCPISDWRPGDDVWEQHARSVPTCIHVMCCMGKEYIDRVVKAAVPSDCRQVEQVFESLKYDKSDINEDTYKIQQAEGNGKFLITLRTNEKNMGVLVSVSHRMYKAQNNGMENRRHFEYEREPSDVERMEDESEVLNGPFIRRQHGAHGVSTGACHPYVTNGGIRFAEPLHPDKCDNNVRKETMNKVPQHLVINPGIVKVAVAAGFYYDESQGQIICYYCGRPYNTGWKSSDDHWSHGGVEPYCFHCIMTKGEPFVIQNYNGSNKEYNLTSPIMQGAANQRMKRKREDNIIEGWSDSKHSKRS